MEGTERFDGIHGYSTFEVILKWHLLKFRNQEASRSEARPDTAQRDFIGGTME
jgi:hypothetical protein